MVPVHFEMFIIYHYILSYGIHLLHTSAWFILLHWLVSRNKCKNFEQPTKLGQPALMIIQDTNAGNSKEGFSTVHCHLDGQAGEDGLWERLVAQLCEEGNILQKISADAAGVPVKQASHHLMAAMGVEDQSGHQSITVMHECANRLQHVKLAPQATVGPSKAVDQREAHQ